MNYSAVAPPSQAGSGDPQSAFADALARARQIAAKINTQPGSEGEPSAMKRPFEGTSESQPDAKKIAAINDPIGAQLRAIADQQRSSQAAQAAAAAASQINAKLGLAGTTPTSNNSAPNMNSSIGSSGPHTGLGMVTTENYQVPDRMVGLIIGKGGEQIAAIQAETGCKVQFAPDSGGLPDRPCTLTGSSESIEQAKDMIQRIIAKGQGLPDPHQMGDGQAMVEVMVPGPKVGLVIGKGGETIKHLQEKAGVKMVMIQDSNQPSHYDKPLRITGDANKCKMAKDMVMELIADKDDEYHGEYGARGNQMEVKDSDYPSMITQNCIPVPRGLVGVVIGRGGDMIKKIQSDTGAKVQFKTDDGQGPDRMCTVTGPQDKVQQAANMINELIDTAMSRGDQGGRGRGRGRGDEPNGPFGDRRPGGGQNRYGGDFQDETNFTVPADKCGLIIGKGGETIREINRQSGAYVELSRNQPPNPRERVFHISGNPDQIQTAIRMMSEKAGIPPPPAGPGGPPAGPGGPPAPPGQGGPGGYDQYGQYGQQPQQQPPGPGPHGYPPQGWSNAYPQWNQAPSGDPNKQAADANAQAWAQYYAQYYGQGGQPNQPPASNGVPQQQQGQHGPPPQQQGPPPQSEQQQPPQPAINPATGQPDYSAAWAEYYRQQGMHYHAQAILQQAGQTTGQQQQPQQQQPPH